MGNVNMLKNKINHKFTHRLLLILSYILLLNFYCLPNTSHALGSWISQTKEQIDPNPTKRIQKQFEQAKVAYPPKQITLIGIKDKKLLELWAQNKNSQWKKIHTYPILAASGKLGPKLREGDLQVPEGLYKIIWLNPNSSYHLSMKINYPNSYDWEKANLEGRKQPGSDIFIHGKAVSIGCLAIGDTAIEELFTLVKTIGVNNAKVILTPIDLRVQKLDPSLLSSLPWLGELYANIQKELMKYHSEIINR